MRRHSGLRPYERRARVAKETGNCVRRLGRWQIGIALSLLGTSCVERVEVGRDLPATMTTSAGASAVATAGSGASSGVLGAGGTFGDGGAAGHTCQVRPCQGRIYQCGDCIDNDGDHLTDSEDPDCTGPCDDTESSYGSGLPGSSAAPCKQGCYFVAQEKAASSDRCNWSQDCDPLSVAPDYPPSGDSNCVHKPGAVVPGSGATCDELSTTQPSACLASCLPITPNGCDCFGCCELPADSGTFVWIGSIEQNALSCDAAHVADPAACHPCTPVKSCFNACEPCEVCVGREAPAPNCATPGVGRCQGMAAACGQPGGPDCAAGYYCVTGCCEAVPP
jgi:hypothetical protein